MKNQFNKITQPIFEVFKGPRTKDYEYEKIIQEYTMVLERLNTIKKLIDSYPAHLEGYKLTLDSLSASLNIIFDKSQNNYSQFMGNIISAHKALSEKLTNMFNKIEELKITLNKWTEHSKIIETKCNMREKTRKDFDHYDEKMGELFEQRNKIITKGKIPTENDNKNFARNLQKFQSSANDYIKATNEAYKSICEFLDARYDYVTMTMIGFIEIEASFFNEASYIFNFFNGARNNAINLKNTFIPTQNNYDAGNFIRGKQILNMKVSDFTSSNDGDEVISGLIIGTGVPNEDAKDDNNKNNNNDVRKRGYSQGKGNNSMVDPFGSNNSSFYNNNNSNYGMQNNNYRNTMSFNNNNNNSSQWRKNSVDYKNNNNNSRFYGNNSMMSNNSYYGNNNNNSNQGCPNPFAYQNQNYNNNNNNWGNRSNMYKANPYDENTNQHVPNPFDDN